MGFVPRIVPSALFADLVEEILRGGAAVRFQASGRSMQPTIADGDVITIEPVLASELREGEVALYRSERGLMAHRLRARAPGANGRCTFRGDARGARDERVRSERIMGRLVRIERQGAQMPRLRRVRAFVRASLVLAGIL
jgi:hypothetical protein